MSREIEFFGVCVCEKEKESKRKYTFSLGNENSKNIEKHATNGTGERKHEKRTKK